MGAAARFHHDHRWRLLGHELRKTLPRQLFAELWLPRHRGSVQLENSLLRIPTKPATYSDTKPATVPI